ncbi:metallophosphoesterase [Bifidobacterium tsurumiense]|uniref:Threonine synthase n=1 Tax=Bifidobacterium tsurumiense TaxID=356829 RepID=A0A087EBI5_9BIFI|nr:threonine synthase [Bifidobacterium tsurumiense]
MIFALSDIHGHFEALEDALSRIGDLKTHLMRDSNTRLIFLGDYVDYGSDSAKVLRKIYHLQQAYPDAVIVLKGNHDQ